MRIRTEIARRSEMMLKLVAAAAIAVAFALPQAPAAAQHRVVEGPPMHNGQVDRHHVRRGFDNGSVLWSGYDLQSSYDDRDWAPESGNDWWHDRPDRALPRWVQEQRARGTCDPDRIWWSGSGWHC
jgi:hypothetical protein